MNLTPVAIELFLDSMSENGVSSNTVRAYKSDLTLWLKWTSNVDSTDLDSLAKLYVNQMRESWKPKTTLRKMSAIKAFGRFLGMELLTGYRPPKPARPMPHPIPEGINAVLEMCEEAPNFQVRALVALCGLSGLRVGEALNIRRHHIDRDTKTILVRGKGDKMRIVPLSQKAWEHIAPAYVLARSEPLVPYSDRGARKALTTLAAKCKFTRPVASHDLRATFATTAYANTNDLRAVQELLGHSSSMTTEVYTGVMDAKMRAAAEVV